MKFLNFQILTKLRERSFRARILVFVVALLAMNMAAMNFMFSRNEKYEGVIDNAMRVQKIETRATLINDRQDVMTKYIIDDILRLTPHQETKAIVIQLNETLDAEFSKMMNEAKRVNDPMKDDLIASVESAESASHEFRKNLLMYIASLDARNQSDNQHLKKFVENTRLLEKASDDAISRVSINAMSISAKSVEIADMNSFTQKFAIVIFFVMNVLTLLVIGTSSTLDEEKFKR